MFWGAGMFGCKPAPINKEGIKIPEGIAAPWETHPNNQKAPFFFFFFQNKFESI